MSELDLLVDLDLDRSSREQQLLAAGREQLARLGIGQMGESIAQADLIVTCLFHDGVNTKNQRPDPSAEAPPLAGRR